MAAGHPPEECVWIGDLSGFQVTEIHHREAVLYHRCGWATSVLPYLGNLVAAARSHTDCRHGVNRNDATGQWEIVHLGSGEVVGAVAMEIDGAERFARDLAVAMNFGIISSTRGTTYG